ncbi:VapC toxin family PIN domain ribonuclease [Brachybacterium vulturis]|uniref:Ribonuclease VapC n=1 Tax=Brachybacterium vulturis TaxID=2017484 RepID=A0A291GLT7_9MICO|nr:type II toxin-antitoxin system VapC family toxin [Brachybacterium vulturis]ATG51022.1 VapC toxin family PIN domain ribonuclease [Brachybacterium vulturis]
MIVYLDTSAVLKILIDEPGGRAMRAAFTGWQLNGDDLVSSFLLHTEMHCAARRRDIVAADVIDMVLGGIGLIDIDRAFLLAAAEGPHRLRSADAIHLATALAVEAEVLVTYDRELAEAAEREGLLASAPGD